MENTAMRFFSEAWASSDGPDEVASGYLKHLDHLCASTKQPVVKRLTEEHDLRSALLDHISYSATGDALLLGLITGNVGTGYIHLLLSYKNPVISCSDPKAIKEAFSERGLAIWYDEFDYEHVGSGRIVHRMLLTNRKEVSFGFDSLTVEHKTVCTRMYTRLVGYLLETM